jgi:hypothetical protein
MGYSPQYLEAYPFVDTWYGENVGEPLEAHRQKQPHHRGVPEGIEVDVKLEEDLWDSPFISTHLRRKDLLIDNTGEDALYGVADTDGNIVVKPQYADINATAKTGGSQLELENGGKRYSYLDKAGNIAIDAYLSTASRSGMDLPGCRHMTPKRIMPRQNGFIDQNGNFIIPTISTKWRAATHTKGITGGNSNFYNGVAAAKVAWADTSITGRENGRIASADRPQRQHTRQAGGLWRD